MRKVFGTLFPAAAGLKLPVTRPAPGTGIAEILKTVSGIVARYNESGYPGTFRVVQGDDRLHIVPIAVRGRDDYTFVRQASVLNVRVSMPSKKARTAEEAISAVLRAASAASGHEIKFATGPLNLLVQTSFESGADNESARDILVRILRATGKGVTWRLQFSPLTKKYYMNLAIINS